MFPVGSPAGAGPASTKREQDATVESIPVRLDDGISLEVKRAGAGPALIIQHGWTGSVLDWMGVIRALEKHLTVVSWDMRPYLAEDARVERMARDLEGVMRALAIERPLLLGHSMGALVSWDYIRQFGCDSLRGLAIVDQSPKVITDGDWSLGLYGKFTESDNAALIDRFAREFIRTVLELVASGKTLTEEEKQAILWDDTMVMRLERLKTLDARSWLNAWRSFVVQDYRPVLSGISVPTLLLYGEKSNFYGSRVARYVAEQIPGAVLKLYPGAGHSPHLDDPRRFVADLVTFSQALA
jgi:pimeloyl-ACP methyl ester carboxylesterase